MMLLVSFVAIVLLVVFHLFYGKLRFLDGTPRSIWLSMAGGVSVAYVFVHLLPELGEAQETVSEVLSEAVAFLENHVYLVALLGMIIFYGLERAASSSRRHRRKAGEGDVTSAGVFWLHIS